MTVPTPAGTADGAFVRVTVFDGTGAGAAGGRVTGAGGGATGRTVASVFGIGTSGGSFFTRSGRRMERDGRALEALELVGQLREVLNGQRATPDTLDADMLLSRLRSAAESEAQAH